MSQIPDVPPAFVSVVNEFPEDLYDAMRGFVRTHPHWDQYRLMQVAVAGFLFQQGCRERAVARHYLDGLFDRGVTAPEASPEASSVAGSRSVRSAQPRVSSAATSAGIAQGAQGLYPAAAPGRAAAAPVRRRHGAGRGASQAAV